MKATKLRAAQSTLVMAPGRLREALGRAPMRIYVGEGTERAKVSEGGEAATGARNIQIPRGKVEVKAGNFGD